MISAHPEWSSYKEAPISGNSFQKWWKSRFRYVDYPFILAYRGFGNADKCYVQGHVFKGMALRKPRKDASVWKNIIALLKMFLVSTIAEAKVELKLNGKTYHCHSNEQGLFEFEIENHGLSEGWNSAEIRLAEELVDGQEEVKVSTEIQISTQSELIFISDIDDTFLVSHVTQKPKKLYTLLTNNAQTRRPVKGAVDFYRALKKGVNQEENPFFYVSSSEWSLYKFLVQFIEMNELPKGVLQLKQLKTGFLDFFKSGYGSHTHKLDKIERILKLYPTKKFVLLGDNGQHDPLIYKDIAEKNSGRIKAVYIRGVKSRHWDETQKILEEIESIGTASCQFRHSQQAFEHAQSIGLISS